MTVGAAAAALTLSSCDFDRGGVGDLIGEILKSSGSGDIGALDNEDIGDDDSLFCGFGLQDSSPCQFTSSFDCMMWNGTDMCSLQ